MMFNTLQKENFNPGDFFSPSSEGLYYGEIGEM